MHSSIDTNNIIQWPHRPYQFIAISIAKFGLHSGRSILYSHSPDRLFVGTSTFPPALASNPAVPCGCNPSRWLSIVRCQHHKHLVETKEWNRGFNTEPRLLALYELTMQTWLIKDWIIQQLLCSIPTKATYRKFATKWSLRSSSLRSLLCNHSDLFSINCIIY